jgi:hypothetical protein
VIDTDWTDSSSCPFKGTYLKPILKNTKIAQLLSGKKLILETRIQILPYHIDFGAGV